MTEPVPAVPKPWKYNPGSAMAGDHGCLCPVMDNNRGMRPPRPPNGWILVVGCPVHPVDGGEVRDAEAKSDR